MNKRRFFLSRTRTGLLLIAALAALAAQPASQAADLRFEVSFPASVRSAPVTGRVFVIVTRNKAYEPRFQAGFWGDSAPIFGVDVDPLAPGAPAVIDEKTLGYPVESLRDIPPGDYMVQAVLNVYTEFHRADGHVIWAHMDQWEGQQFNTSPGNLLSEPQLVHLDRGQGYGVKVELTRTIPPVEVPADTVWVKHVKIQSKLLTAFWGRPMFLGATVLLPRGYAEHPAVRYPVIYVQDHFSLSAPFRFRSDNPTVTDRDREVRHEYGFESGREFFEAWNSDGFPRMIAVKFQHPTPYFDDSYAVNSANNGPYGDALLTELIPYLEEHFRIIREPYARVLTGGSTGGWESLALQVFHPDFFGGTWTFYPDPVDFRRYQLTNIYEDDNAFFLPGREWLPAERTMERASNGQPVVTTRDFSRLEEVLGSHGRSAQQLEAWEAVYGPVGEDGYPKPLWDKRTGKIDRTVAAYMRDHGYDLRYNLETNWPKVGPELVGKIHLYCGDMDNYYLNLAVYLLEAFLKDTQNPYYAGSFEYGRPMKGHGWQPMTNSELVRAMAGQISKRAPAGQNPSSWNYN